MFTADTFIDTVSTAKKEFVKTFVKHDAIAKSMNEFVDAQAKYTKEAAKAGTDVATKMASELVKVTQEAAKVDYTKKFSEAFGSFAKAFDTKK
jgi:hypothetical protein